MTRRAETWVRLSGRGLRHPVAQRGERIVRKPVLGRGRLRCGLAATSVGRGRRRAGARSVRGRRTPTRGERDSLPVEIDLEHADLDAVADFDDLVRVLHELVGELRNVNE